jgi:uracil-DNA glycosylase family 4
MNQDSVHAQYLNAMGIQVWVRRHIPTPIEQEIVKPEIVKPEIVKQEKNNEVNWKDLESQVTACTACDIARTKKLFGIGDSNADLMLITEAPKENEEVQGKPFVDQIGTLFDHMLYAIDLKRESIYITNVIKCSTDKNPTAKQLAACDNFLQQQIALIKPKLIVVTGRIAAHYLLKNDDLMNKLRGQVFEYGDKKIPLIVTYHPKYLLHRPTEKANAWQDLQLIAKTLANLKS